MAESDRDRDAIEDALTEAEMKCAALEQRAVAAERERDDVIAALETLRAHFLAKIEAGEVAPMPICGWCGMPMADVEEFRAHAVACEKNPPVQRALAAEAERDRGLADMLRFQAAYIKADHERLAAEAEAKRAKEALRLLLTEVEQSGNGNAKDFGWPPALSAARTVLGDGPFNSLGIKIVAVPRDALAKEADHE